VDEHELDDPDVPRPSRAALGCGLVALLCAVAPTPARASGRTVVEAHGITQVALAGNHVIYAPDNRAIDSVVPGAAPTKLADGPGPAGRVDLGSGNAYDVSQLVWRASVQSLAYLWETVRSSPGGSAKTAPERTGPLGGPYAPLGVCGTLLLGDPGVSPDFPLLAVDGTHVAAWPSCPAAGSSLSIIIRDTAAQTDTTIAVPRGTHVGKLALAGSALAAYEQYPSGSAAVVVYDLGTGMVRYQVDASTSGSIAALAVQSDGKAAVAFDVTPTGPVLMSPTRVIYWTDATAPTFHQIATGACIVFPGVGLRIAGDVIARDDCQAITLVDLSGATVSKPFALGQLPAQAFDFDGMNLAVAIPVCDGNAAVQLAAATGNDTSRPSAACPVSIAPRSLRLKRRATTALLRCAHGCRGRLSLAATGVTSTSRAFALHAPGGSVTITSLPKPLRTHASQPGGTPVTLDLVTYDLDGSARRQHRRLQLTTH
jgi:hypothetical protein